MKYLPLLLLLLSGCSPNFYCKKCKQQTPTKTDTVWTETIVEVPSAWADTVTIALPGDTVTITKDRLVTKFVKLPKDSVWIYTNCLPDTIKINVPTMVTNEIKTGISFWHLIVACLAVAGVVAILFLLKR